MPGEGGRLSIFGWYYWILCTRRWRLAGAEQELRVYEEAIQVYRAYLEVQRRTEGSPVGPGNTEDILRVQSHIVLCHSRLGRPCLDAEREIYAKKAQLDELGPAHRSTLLSANNLACSLLQTREPHHRAEADALLLESSALAEQKHGRDSEIFLMLRWSYAESLFRFNSDASVENLVEAEGVLEEIVEKWQRPMEFGKSRTHPQTAEVLKDLATVQDMIARARAADATD